jgi:hypothetical protein
MASRRDGHAGWSPEYELAWDRIHQVPQVVDEPGQPVRGGCSGWDAPSDLPPCACARCRESGGCRHDGLTVHGLCYFCAAEHREGR